MKRAAWAFGALAAVLGAVVAGALWRAEQKMTRTVDVPPHTLQVRGDAQSVERGRYLYASRGCADCHGANGAGRMFLDEGGLRIKGPNISPGPGSVVAGYRPQDWHRAIRHGVHRSGRPLMVMPSEDYNRWTDADLAAVVAYLQQLPPAAGEGAIIELPLPVRALYGLGVMTDAAEKIDHRLPPAQPVPEGVNVAHGRYVANMCFGCHGAQLEGGRIPGAPPDWPPASRLAPGPDSVMATRYASADALVALFRTGKRPDGSAVKVMPFEALGQMSDTDVRALHLYLTSLK